MEKHNKIKRVNNLLSSEVLRYWMLNTAVESEVRLTDFFPELNSQGLNVRPVPGCSAEQYANALIDLFESDLITFSSQVEGDDTRNRDDILWMIERFRNLQKTNPTLLDDSGHLFKGHQLYRLPDNRVSFKLTSLGGEVWEKSAAPDWAHYISESTVFPAFEDQGADPLVGDGDLISADRDRIIAYMGWYPEVRGEYIEVETVNWQTHMDFEILYWKRLPFVHHASFRVQVVEGRWRCVPPKWFQEWWSATKKWHTEPWDLPNWPSA